MKPKKVGLKAHPWPQIRMARIEPVIAYRGEPVQFSIIRRSTQQHHVWWQICRGTAVVTMDRIARRIPAGRWVLLPASVAREQRFEQGTEIVSLNFTAAWGNGRPMLCGRELLSGLVSGAKDVCEAAEDAAKTFEHDGRTGHISLADRKLDFIQWTIMHAALHRFVGLLLPRILKQGWKLAEAGTGDARMDAVLDLISLKPQAGPLPYDEWQLSLGVGRAQLDRLAREHLGSTLRAHRDKLLIGEIRRRLLLERPSMKEIAAEYGFVDSAHFTHWVTRQTGSPPAMMARALV